VSGVTIRPARPADFERLGAMFARAELGGPSMAGELAFVQGRLDGEAFVADAEGELVGASAAVAFGVNGWIGGVAVLPERRGAGLGSALTATAARWITVAGAGTVSLHATAMGRPIYERLGFAADGRWLRLTIGAEAGSVETARLAPADPSVEASAGAADRPGLPAANPPAEARRGEAGGTGRSAADPRAGVRPGGVGGRGLPAVDLPLGVRLGEARHPGPSMADPPVGIRAARAGDLDAVLALDRVVTGEDRGRLLRAVWGSGCLVAEDTGGRVVGFHARKPAGGVGGATVARHERAGAALQAAWRQPGSEASVVLPEANTAGRRALEALGYRMTGATTLMRRGPAPTYRPESVFGGFNLFWS
jgi:GNAT superfamily N-acetyltransferase